MCCNKFTRPSTWSGNASPKRKYGKCSIGKNTVTHPLKNGLSRHDERIRNRYLSATSVLRLAAASLTFAKSGPLAPSSGRRNRTPSFLPGHSLRIYSSSRYIKHAGDVCSIPAQHLGKATNWETRSRPSPVSVGWAIDRPALSQIDGFQWNAMLRVSVGIWSRLRDSRAMIAGLCRDRTTQASVPKRVAILVAAHWRRRLCSGASADRPAACRREAPGGRLSRQLS